MVKKKTKKPEYPSYDERNNWERDYKKAIFTDCLNILPSHPECLKLLNSTISPSKIRKLGDTLYRPYTEEDNQKDNIWCSGAVTEFDMRKGRVVAVIQLAGRNEEDAWHETVVISPQNYSDSRTTVYDLIDDLANEVTERVDGLFYRIWRATYNS